MSKSPVDFYTSGFYAKNARKLRTLGASASPKPAPSTEPHCSVVANIESSSGDVFEASVDDDVTEKEVAVCFFDLQTYRCEEDLLIIF